MTPASLGAPVVRPRRRPLPVVIGGGPLKSPLPAMAPGAPTKDARRRGRSRYRTPPAESRPSGASVAMSRHPRGRPLPEVRGALAPPRAREPRPRSSHRGWRPRSPGRHPPRHPVHPAGRHRSTALPAARRGRPHRGPRAVAGAPTTSRVPWTEIAAPNPLPISRSGDCSVAVWIQTPASRRNTTTAPELAAGMGKPVTTEGRPAKS